MGSRPPTPAGNKERPSASATFLSGRQTSRHSLLSPGHLRPARGLRAAIHLLLIELRSDTAQLAPYPSNPETTVYIRDVFTNAAAQVLNSILIPAWKSETNSLNLETIAAPKDESERTVANMPLSEDPIICDAEEFVCLHYVAYIQNIMARMRTMTLSMALLFVSVCFAISFYPFVPPHADRLLAHPEPGVHLRLGPLRVCRLERDETLSYITSNKAGKLSPDFWFKTIGFLAGPVIGIVTTQFPAIADSVLGWLQPGLDAIR